MGCNCNKSDSFSFKQDETSIISSGILSIEKKSDSIYEPLVSDDEQLKRLEICKACEYYAIIMGKEKCTTGRPTFLRAKISLRDQTCPSEEKKW